MASQVSAQFWDKKEKDVKPVHLTIAGKNEYELGAASWVSKPRVKPEIRGDSESYPEMAQKLDVMGHEFSEHFKSQHPTEPMGNGQAAAHAVLLAVHQDVGQLKTRYGVEKDSENHKYLLMSGAVFLGAEAGRAPIAGLSNHATLEQMALDREATFAGDNGTLTKAKLQQHETGKNPVEPNLMLSGPVGSVPLMQAAQNLIDNYTEKGGSSGKWANSVMETLDKQENLANYAIKQSDGKNKQFPALTDKTVGGKRGAGKITLPNPLSTVQNEATKFHDLKKAMNAKYGTGLTTPDVIERTYQLLNG